MSDIDTKIQVMTFIVYTVLFLTTIMGLWLNKLVKEIYEIQDSIQTEKTHKDNYSIVSSVNYVNATSTQ